jgi:hypothetical protein
MLNSVGKTGLQTVASNVAIAIACDPNSVKYFLTLKAGTATAGTLTLTATPCGVGASEAVYESDGITAITQNLATTTQKTYVIEGSFDAINVACAGSNGTYKYALQTA